MPHTSLLAMRAMRPWLAAVQRACGSVLVLSLVWGQGLPAGAADEPSAELVQRERIDKERRQAVFNFEVALRECQSRFAVTACVDAARTVQRDKLDSLRRQEEVLDGNERRRRAAERLEVIREKTEAQARAVPPATSATSRPGPAAGGSSAQGASGHSAARSHAPASAPLPMLRGLGAAPSAAARAQAERSAAERAATSRQRREAAARRQQEKREKPAVPKRPAAPLPLTPSVEPAPAASAPR